MRALGCDKPNEDSWRRPDRKDWDAEDGGASRVLTGMGPVVSFMVFIHWYLLLRQT